MALKLSLCLVFETWFSWWYSIKTKSLFTFRYIYYITIFMLCFWFSFLMFWIKKIILIITQLPILNFSLYLWILLTNQHFFLFFVLAYLRPFLSFILFFRLGLCTFIYRFLNGFYFSWFFACFLYLQPAFWLLSFGVLFGYHFSCSFGVEVWLKLNKSKATCLRSA